MQTTFQLKPIGYNLVKVANLAELVTVLICRVNSGAPISCPEKTVECSYVIMPQKRSLLRSELLDAFKRCNRGIPVQDYMFQLELPSAYSKQCHGRFLCPLCSPACDFLPVSSRKKLQAPPPSSVLPKALLVKSIYVLPTSMMPISTLAVRV